MIQLDKEARRSFKACRDEKNSYMWANPILGLDKVGGNIIFAYYAIWSHLRTFPLLTQSEYNQV